MAGIARDIDGFAHAGAMGWTFLVLVFGLPVGCLAAAICGRLFAILAFGVSLLLLFSCWSYYTAPGGAVSGPGMTGALLALALVGWMLLVFAVARPWRWRAWRAYRELLDPRPLFKPEMPD